MQKYAGDVCGAGTDDVFVRILSWMNPAASFVRGQYPSGYDTDLPQEEAVLGMSHDL